MDLGDLKCPQYGESAELIAYWQERAKSGDAWASQFLDLLRNIVAIGRYPILEWPDVR
jgi:hypothetical protein